MTYRGGSYLFGSVRASVTNLLRPVEEWHCGGTPIPSMMNFERRKGK